MPDGVRGVRPALTPPFRPRFSPPERVAFIVGAKVRQKFLFNEKQMDQYKAVGQNWQCFFNFFGFFS
jgi:hypothetical protein